VETPAQNPTEATSPNATVTTPAPAVVTTEQPASTPTLLSDEAKAPPATADEVKPPPGAPEKYEFTAPKGQSYDPQVIEEFSTAAKEANLTQDAAQKLIEKMAPALATRQQAQIAAIHQQWVEASTTDKEFGGDKLKENLGIAKKALATFSTPELSRLLEDTGLGNHPEVVRMLVRVGRAISEDGYVSGSPGPAKVNMGDFSSIANALYPPKG
jgi:hypothetical protein